MSTFGERLVEQYYGLVQGYVRMRVPAQDHEDLVSEVFLRAIEHHDQLQGDAGPWLFAIMRNRVAEYHRRKGRVIPMDLHAVEDGQPARFPAGGSLEPLARLESVEFRARLQRHLLGLTEVERDVIALKFTDDLTNTQIAALLGVTPSHLGVLLHRALRRLRDRMLHEA